MVIEEFCKYCNEHVENGKFYEIKNGVISVICEDCYLENLVEPKSEV